MSEEALLSRACQLAGIEPSYVDIWGEQRGMSGETRRALLAAMGVDASGAETLAPTIEAFERRPWRRALPKLSVVTDAPGPVRVNVVLPADRSQETVRWNLDGEDGARLEGEFSPSDLPLVDSRTVDGRTLERRALALDAAIPHGYHDLTLRFADGTTESGRIAVAPAQCYLPEAFERGERIWGVSIQLYALRSRRNWGIGDFTDLARFAEIVARLGGGAIGLNPLHALFPGDPERASPYSPISRRFLNLLYLDVESVLDFRDCTEARDRVRAPSFQARLESLRAAPLVDYTGIAACKLEILEIAYRCFASMHLASGTRRAREFHRYKEERGRYAELFGVYHAMAESFGKNGPPIYDWRAWPQAFRDPGSTAVDAWIEENRRRVDFFIYLAWQTERQFRRAVRRCERLGMPVGVYQDLALGADPGGLEAWIDQDVLATGIGLGAPPDELNQQGQSWGMPPYDPHALAEHGWAPFVAILRANMAHGGALRIDHVLGLFRQFWVPRDRDATDGGYVRNSFETLVNLIALESHRNRCLVIGEDLGTVPPGLRESLERARILSYRLLFFERDSEGGFRPPERYPGLALAALRTHDMASFPGWWTGHDLDVRRQAGLLPDADDEAAERARRRHDRKALVRGLARAGYSFAESGGDDPTLPPSSDLVTATHAYLARAPSLMLMVHLEDALDELGGINVPGTFDEHPNWRRKLPVALHSIGRDRRITRLARVLREARPAAGG